MVSTRNNLFRPRCKCFDGFRSSNPMNKRILLRDIDACVECQSNAECGFVPTALPTSKPTLSHIPSPSPSLSQVPSMKPSDSGLPSYSPTTVSPTMPPSSSSGPSLSPSLAPSLSGVFDGGMCRYPGECLSKDCEAGVCTSEVCYSHEACPNHLSSSYFANSF